MTEKPTSAARAAAEPTRLSRTSLWPEQRTYFHGRGIAAWSRDDVPHYITNNPALAGRYAAVAAERIARSSSSDEPLYLIELGAGCGRFAHAVVLALLELCDRAGLPPRFRYVMTDLVPANVAHFAEHPAMREYFERGLVDCAVFDVEAEGSISLQRSGIRLGPGAIQGPMIAVANYVFDGLPQDAFLVRDGVLFERPVTVVREALDAGPTQPFYGVELELSERLAEQPYYSNSMLERVLRARVRQAAVEEKFLFPCAALAAIDRLASWSRGLLLLAGDRSYVAAGGALAEGEALAVHGSFSLPVDYRAIAQYFREHGGEMLHTEGDFQIAAGLLDLAPGEAAAARLAFSRAFEGSSYQAYFVLRRSIQEHGLLYELSPILALLELSRYDPTLLAHYLPVLSRLAPAFSPAEVQMTARVVRRCWKSYFPIGEDVDLAFGLGILFHRMSCFEDALAMFEASQRSFPDPRTSWNIAACLFALGRVEEALRRIAAGGPGSAMPLLGKEGWSV